MIRKYVARQVIVDQRQKSFAYELLYRNSLGNSSEGLRGDAGVKELVSTLSLDFKTEELTLGNRAFIYLPRVALMSDAIMFLEASQYVFEITEDVRYDNELVARIEFLRTKHYQFALGNYTGTQDFSRIEKSITYIKVNFKETPLAKQKEIVYEYKKRKRKRLLADKIDTEEEFLQAKELDYDLYQGGFFAHPQLIIRESIGFNQHSVIMLLRELHEEDSDFNKIDRIINTDAGLTYRLLARGNTMAFAGKNKFTTASQVVVRMGIEELQRWATLMLMQESAEPGQEEKLEHALLRAVFLESLAIKMNPALSRQERYYIYLKGMFSIFPADKREEIFGALDFELTPVLFDEANDLLAFNYAYEVGNYELVDIYLLEKGLTEAIVMGCYRSAISNVNESLNG